MLVQIQKVISTCFSYSSESPSVTASNGDEEMAIDGELSSYFLDNHN